MDALSTTPVGFLLAIVIGIFLGIMGGGGSILTIPVLVYVIGINPMLATTYSLFIVGATSLLGAMGYARRKLLNVRVALLFAMPSMASVFLVRKLLLPLIPQVLFSTGSVVFTRDLALMLFFALVMLFAALPMIGWHWGGQDNAPETKAGYGKIMLEGLKVGLVTGFVGAGGGFLIVPGLVLLLRLPMQLAVGTSLLVIAINSLVGFAGSMTRVDISWDFLLIFTALSVAGIYIGGYLGRFIAAERLKHLFGWFLIVMAIYIVSTELFF